MFLREMHCSSTCPSLTYSFARHQHHYKLAAGPSYCMPSALLTCGTIIHPEANRPWGLQRDQDLAGSRWILEVLWLVIGNGQISGPFATAGLLLRAGMWVCFWCPKVGQFGHSLALALALALMGQFPDTNQERRKKKYIEKKNAGIRPATETNSPCPETPAAETLGPV